MPENHDAEDVQAILARDSQDGPGDLDNLPPSDLDHDGSNGGGDN